MSILETLLPSRKPPVETRHRKTRADEAGEEALLEEASIYGIGPDSPFVRFALEGNHTFRNALILYAAQEPQLSVDATRAGIINLNARDILVLRGHYDAQTQAEDAELDKARQTAEKAREKADEIEKRLREKAAEWSRLLDLIPRLEHTLTDARTYAANAEASAAADPTQALTHMGPYCLAGAAENVIRGIAIAKQTAPLYRACADKAAADLREHLGALLVFARANKVPRNVWPDQINRIEEDRIA